MMYSEKGNELNPFILSVPLFIQFISHSFHFLLKIHIHICTKEVQVYLIFHLIISSLQTELTPN